ncbi:hypothetical protein [uncultured Pontibacter sp.]|uniref:hypothetical protein n=1 Tax=uncultured Pontibacter sp. TaxID=453356 RepID=UPI00262AE80E|nr:hypothetical protein [uncultured Pontibacter sp.]
MNITKGPLNYVHQFSFPLTIALLMICFSCESESSITSTLNSNEVQSFSYSKKVESLTGFRNFKLGSDIGLYPELTAVIDPQARSIDDYIYVNGNEYLKIGDVDIEDIEYSFMNNKLRQISFKVPNKGVSKLIQAYLDKYGRGKISKEFGDSIVAWENGDFTLEIVPWQFGSEYHRVIYESKLLSEEFRAGNFGVTEETYNKIMERKKAIQNDL